MGADAAAMRERSAEKTAGGTTAVPGAPDGGS
jgi:hypothetical protein